MASLPIEGKLSRVETTSVRGLLELLNKPDKVKGPRLRCHHAVVADRERRSRSGNHTVPEQRRGPAADASEAGAQHARPRARSGPAQGTGPLTLLNPGGFAAEF